MPPLSIPQLAQLRKLRGNPIMLYSAGIADDSIPIFYECLRREGHPKRLDLILSTSGGSILATRRIALLLREYVEHLTILVPYRAWSAGTLLGLSANELVLGPLSELSPIDANNNSASMKATNEPSTVSAEEVRMFQQMAADWFGVTRDQDRLQVLALVAQRFFPTSLCAIYRSAQLVNRIANELLAYQLPETNPTTRQNIVDQLISAYYDHNYQITRQEARTLGLNIQYATLEEEQLLWDIWQKCDTFITPDAADPDPERNVMGILMGEQCFAQLTRDWNPTSQWSDQDNPFDGLNVAWEMH